MRRVKGKEVVQHGVVGLLVLIMATCLTPTDLIISRGRMLQGMVGSYASAGNFELKVH